MTATIHADLTAHILGALGVTTHLTHLTYGSVVHECRHAEHDDTEAGTVDVYLVDDQPYLDVCHRCATYIATWEQACHADIRSIECPSILCDDEARVA